MHQNPGGLLRPLLLAALIFATSAWARAATTQAEDTSAGDETIEIASTVSFGKTPVGVPVSRSFQLANKDTSRSMRLYGFGINQGRNQEWAITKRPDGWIPPGESVELTIMFVPSRLGEHKVGISWYVEMNPVSEEEDKDNFFVFNAVGEALENQDPPE